MPEGALMADQPFQSNGDEQSAASKTATWLGKSEGGSPETIINCSRVGVRLGYSDGCGSVAEELVPLL